MYLTLPITKSKMRRCNKNEKPFFFFSLDFDAVETCDRGLNCRKIIICS